MVKTIAGIARHDLYDGKNMQFFNDITALLKLCLADDTR
jgi:hypothetical protein